MRLADVEGVRKVGIDPSDRTVAVYHDGSVAHIEAMLTSLKLGSSLVETAVSTEFVSDSPNQRRILWAVLLINFGFFAIEMTAGLFSRSMGLIADSLDMLADSFVYGLSLLAVGTTVAHKKAVAKWSGYLQAVLALVGFVEVLRRFFGFTELPDYRTMIIVSIMALIANIICLLLLQKTRDRDAHIQASMIFTSNDIIINVGVIAAGVLVSLLGSNVPDLLVGGVVFLIVTRGAVRILALSK